MSALFDRLSKLFGETEHIGIEGIRDDSAWVTRQPRDAAVLMAVTDRKEPGLLLTHRPKTMAAHPGQVSFPGGKLEEGEDAITAALREAEEELAIPQTTVRVVGTAQHFMTGTGFNLTPVLGLVPHDLQITPDPREVDGWFEAPLRYVLDRRNHVQKMGQFGPLELPYTEIVWEGHRIWGITAGIIANLSHRLVWEELIGD
ncbi:CoA pyrophosphatase [Aurantiacibacter sediminis]|uniref:CoA pyrophosphatase n=1 Tax=Aurantiacibacter sediminis TaxID=2793064 RepID=A0ABS0N5J0_9SPHN|nr:CoA pyrophosphatase [Aurantiacibacter sediminis]MBH5323051.1 CoA pyrophosphatase [Aurantiacibacter sediminis]